MQECQAWWGSRGPGSGGSKGGSQGGWGVGVGAETGQGSNLALAALHAPQPSGCAEQGQGGCTGHGAGVQGSQSLAQAPSENAQGGGGRATGQVGATLAGNGTALSQRGAHWALKNPVGSLVRGHGAAAELGAFRDEGGALLPTRGGG